MNETLTIGRAVVTFVKPYFELFKTDGFAPALSLGLLVLAAVLAIIFLFGYVLPIRWTLWRKTLVVRRTGNYEGFARDLHTVDKTITKSRLLRHAWREFRETLIEPRDTGDEAPLVRNTVRAHDYFNVHEARLHFRFFRALPNFFVGAGLLLTFFGLVSALYFATQGIAEGTDFNQTQSALRDLLHAASFKFYTSVAGLASSIVLGQLVRWGTSFVETGFENLSEALEERLLLVTPEAISYEDSRELKQQTVYLKLFTTDVAISVGRYVEEALNKTLPVHLASAMEPVARKLEEVTGGLTRMNEDALKSMADGFGEKLQGAAGDQVKALATVLQDLKLSLDGISTRMNSSGVDLADRIHQSTDEMRAAVSAMAGAMNEIAAKVEGGAARSNEALDRQLDATQKVMTELSERIASSVDATAGRMKQGSEDAAANFTSEIGGAARELRVASAQLAGLTGTARDTEAALAGAARSIREASAPLTTAGQTMADSTRRIADAIDKAVASIQASEDRTRALADRISTTLEQVTRTWADYEQRFAGVDKSLEIALGSIIGQVQKSMDVMHKYVLEMDGKLAETIDRLGGGIGELSEFSEGIERAAVELKKSVDRLVPSA